MDTSTDALSPAFVVCLRDRLEHLDDGAAALTVLVERLVELVADDHATELAALRFAARALSEGIAEAAGTARRIAG
jgi:hypothetical protein